jgi:hypothetical protein
LSVVKAASFRAAKLRRCPEFHADRVHVMFGFDTAA